MGEFLIRVLGEWDITDPHLVCPDAAWVDGGYLSGSTPMSRP